MIRKTSESRSVNRKKTILNQISKQIRNRIKLQGILGTFVVYTWKFGGTNFKNRGCLAVAIGVFRKLSPHSDFKKKKYSKVSEFEILYCLQPPPYKFYHPTSMANDLWTVSSGNEPKVKPFHRCLFAIPTDWLTSRYKPQTTTPVTTRLLQHKSRT